MVTRAAIPIHHGRACIGSQLHHSEWQRSRRVRMAMRRSAYKWIDKISKSFFLCSNVGRKQGEQAKNEPKVVVSHVNIDVRH